MKKGELLMAIGASMAFSEGGVDRPREGGTWKSSRSKAGRKKAKAQRKAARAARRNGRK